jgi:hypothetical protein
MEWSPLYAAAFLLRLRLLSPLLRSRRCHHSPMRRLPLAMDIPKVVVDVYVAPEVMLTSQANLLLHHLLFLHPDLLLCGQYNKFFLRLGLLFWVEFLLGLLVLGHERVYRGHGLIHISHERMLILVFLRFPPFARVHRIPEICAIFLNLFG